MSSAFIFSMAKEKQALGTRKDQQGIQHEKSIHFSMAEKGNDLGSGKSDMAFGRKKMIHLH